MNIKEKTENYLLSPVKKWRETLWHEYGIRDAPPSIGYMIDGDEQYGYPPTHVLNDLFQQAGDDFASVIFTVIKTRASFDGFTRFREVITILDSYGVEDMATAREEGMASLEEDFQTNPASKVTEQVTVIIAADDLVGGAEAVVGLMPYAIGDGGRMKWGEPKVFVESDDDMAHFDSQIVDAMKWGVLHAHEG